MTKLKLLGFDEKIASNVESEKLEKHEIARVIAVHKDRYVVNNGDNEVFSELTGKLLYAINSAVELPTTGDWVYVDYYDNNNHAIIHGLVNRKSLMKRKSSGKQIDFQLIAANIDVAFIVQSLDYNFNLRRLERYLVMIHESNVTPIILLSKSDLQSQDETRTIVNSIHEITENVMVKPFSNQNSNDIEAIKSLFQSGKTYCLLGSSGVGKTTLLNTLIGKQLFETSSVSRVDNKGRHTTTSRQLIQLDCGALIIDTPGMRELGNLSVETGIRETFSEIQTMSVRCKFSNCSHVNEKGCAILAAINAGIISKKRYQSYKKMLTESSFNDMSYLEKKHKNKNFTKLIKSTIKNKRE